MARERAWRLQRLDTCLGRGAGAGATSHLAGEVGQAEAGLPSAPQLGAWSKGSWNRRQLTPVY